jgi:hypothetical protein
VLICVVFCVVLCAVLCVVLCVIVLCIVLCACVWCVCARACVCARVCVCVVRLNLILKDVLEKLENKVQEDVSCCSLILLLSHPAVISFL